MRIASFNVQNLRWREDDAGAHMDGARDADTPQDAGQAVAALDSRDRQLTAKVLRDIDADVVALQEVFDLATLDRFHDAFLMPTGARPYPHRVCLPGNDGRGQDVALLSRIPLTDIRSHAQLTPADLGMQAGPETDRPIFRRDCLMATARSLTLAVCHFKAPYPDPQTAWHVRRREALAVRHLLTQRFPLRETGRWLILGDLNEQTGGTARRDTAISPLTDDFGIDLLAKLPDSERWTYLEPDANRRSCPDAMIASPALARDWPDATPVLVREGMGRETGNGRARKLEGVGWHRPHASDHAAVVIEFPGL